MTEVKIKDGSGTGTEAKVDKNQRLRVGSVQVSEAHKANENGDAYNINTGPINLSDAADTPIIYFKNNESRDYDLELVVIGLGASDGTAGEEIVITFIRNPTVGTIITSTPTNVDINSNRNYGSSNTLNADVFKGATGDTMTDGADHILVFGFEPGRLSIPVDEVIPQGKSFGVKITPPPSSADMNVYVALVGYLADPDSTS